MKRSTKSVVLKLKPINLVEAEEAFFESGCSVNPIFAYRNGRVHSALKKHSVVDFSLLGEAERIIKSCENPQKDATNDVTGSELLQRMRDYVVELGVVKQVVFQEARGMLSIATVLKPGSETPAQERRPIVSVNPDARISSSLADGILAHELGTHLLRMINDDHQIWAGAGRKTYKLANHFATEEGLATINTLVGSGEKLMWNSALNYVAACKAARLSFVELFKYLEPYTPDESKRFKLCARVKRGLVDTSQPGACSLDQNYFGGAVEILRSLSTVDIRLLYCGQIALEDLRRLKNVIRTSCIKLPPFMATPERYSDYVESLKLIAQANMLS